MPHDVEKHSHSLLPSDPELKVKALEKFYLAEVNHQDYFANNPNVPYCTFVIAPKINKLEKKGLFNDDE